MGISGVPTWNLLSRFQGKEWIRFSEHGYFPVQLLSFQAVPIEAVDASDCAINYEGLDNLCEWGGEVEMGGALHFPFRGGLQRDSECHLPSPSCSGPAGAAIPVAAALSPCG